MILGHSHPAVLEATQRALRDGASFGACCELEVEFAELVVSRVPSLEMVRMVNSGTEATMDAIRVARGVTGRDKIVKVEGGYHGHHDEVMVSMKPPLHLAGPADAPNTVPATAGITAAVLGDTIVVPIDAGYTDNLTLWREVTQVVFNTTSGLASMILVTK